MTDSYFKWAAQLFDAARIHEKPEALHGIRVLDLSVIIFGPATADFLGELGALAALRWRDRTGEGQFVEMAQCEGLLRAMDWTWLYAGLTKRDRPQTGNRDPVFSPSGVFRCKGGYVALVAGTDAEYRGLCRVLGKPGLARNGRKDVDRLDGMIQAWCEKRTRSEVEKIARRHHVPAAPVMTGKDHYESRHLRARRSVWEHDDPVYGTMVEYGPAPKLSATPARIKGAGKAGGVP